MFEWFKDKFKKKEDEVKEELQEVKDEISSEENQEELEEIHEKLEEVSEEGNLSEEDLETSEEIEDTNEKFQDKEVIEEAIEKKTEEIEDSKEEIKEDEFTEDNLVEEKEEDKDLEEIHEKLEKVEGAGDLSKEEVETSEGIEDTNEEFQDKEIIEEAIDNKAEEKEENQENLEEEVEEVTEEPKKASLFQRLMDGLDKTRKEVGIKINTVLGAYVKIDDEMLEDLEDILVSADVGMETTMKLIDNLRETIIREKVNDPKEVKPLLLKEAKKLMNPELNTKINSDPPVIILVVGVNGVGKTTTIGKLSQRFKNENKSVLVCAADTFRAAAIDQLKEWGIRANVDVISHDEGSDPAAVVFDAIEAAKARNTDVLIVDTAGRLHNKSNLMKELEKINRIISKKYPEANRENLLVLDSTTGQNAINQAKTFKEVTDISAIALTKLDGTAKGGVVIALQSELGIPIKLIGVGEGIDDLQDFNIDTFLGTIFG
ncbi:MAG: signal recognition particle-docking protein FtsY [Peptoniphilus grossensis]|uniref:signal recognition particle-docking protein FtsY n=1 Tax=Peptoniphilus grossensis TaxID=1465756 RepID=UPI00288AC724|nr:signal recognition particle-docking protein FtsY [Peptoniphilus grossensis]MDU7151752.1 signal recognition particle-docking protein FtsY [Peptoniphilus grossensis]